MVTHKIRIGRDSAGTQDCRSRSRKWAFVDRSGAYCESCCAKYGEILSSLFPSLFHSLVIMTDVGTIGLGLSACTVPSAGKPSFELPVISRLNVFILFSNFVIYTAK